MKLLVQLCVKYPLPHKGERNLVKLVMLMYQVPDLAVLVQCFALKGYYCLTRPGDSFHDSSKKACLVGDSVCFESPVVGFCHIYFLHITLLICFRLFSGILYVTASLCWTHFF